MKKKLNKVMAIVMAATMALGIMAVSPASKAEAALGATSIPMNSQFAYGGTAYIHTSQDYANIYATYEAAYNSYVYVRLSVQVYDGGWRTIETKGGYATKEWGNTDNFNTTFYNYSTAGTRTFRIKVAIYSGHDTSDLMQTAYSSTWTR